MSNELAVLDAGLPSYLKEMEIDDVTKNLMGGSGTGIKRISIRGGVWRMMVNGKEAAKNEERSMNLVIVNAAAKVARTYYSKLYSEGSEPSAPECWSADGDRPDPKVEAPQASRCVDCPKNVKGSGQGDSRACRYSQRLAVVLGNDIGGDIYQLTLPAASLFGEGSPGKWPLQTYAKMIASKGLPISTVVTEARFDTDSATPKLTFKPVRVLTKEEAIKAIEQGKTPAATMAVTITVAEADGVKPKALPAASEEQFEQTNNAAPAAEQKAEQKPEPEPTKRTAKKEEPAAEKKDLAAVIAEWDD